MSSRHLQEAFEIRLPKTSSRRLEDIFNTSSHQDIFKKRSCNYVLKTSWKTKNVTLITSSRRLHQDEFLLGTKIIVVVGFFHGECVTVIWKFLDNNCGYSLSIVNLLEEQLRHLQLLGDSSDSSDSWKSCFLQRTTLLEYFV